MAKKFQNYLDIINEFLQKNLDEEDKAKLEAKQKAEKPSEEQKPAEKKEEPKKEEKKEQKKPLKEKPEEPSEPAKEEKPAEYAAEPEPPTPPKKMIAAFHFNPGDRVVPRVIDEEMKSSYLNYAMSVIVGRALPDVKDGLKPVHRRILFGMNDMGMLHSKPFKKCARIVGEVLGKYHPHGDTAVYDSLVRMVQPFSLRYPLVQGQGNFGSIDGDNQAAMRYTEARLAKIAEELLQDIDKETVDFVPNFDGSLNEPTLLPSKLPNLLLNGSSGIAVGMATNIPPHNLREVCDGIIAQINNPGISIIELAEIIKGPDFPTGGIICGRSGILNYFTYGKGKLKVRSKVDIEDNEKKKRIILNEIPYMINKSMLVEQIADLVKEKVITEISDIRDESDKEGIRVVIELKRDANTEVVLNKLYKHSRVQVTFGVIMLALVNNQPKVLNIKQIVEQYILHRRDVVRRRTKFDLDKAEKKAHVLEGLKIALDNIDRVISLIKGSKSAEAAKTLLSQKFSLTEMQSQAILDMKLQRLTALEQSKLKEELNETLKIIVELKAILASEQRILSIIKNELEGLKKDYSDKRRTEITSEEDEDIEIEDMIKEEGMVVTVTHSGYIKRLPIDTYKQQRRGGKGVIATGKKDEDFVEHLFIANTHSDILFFTSKGQVHWLKVYKVPEGSRQSKGKAVVNLISIPQDETVTAVVPISNFDDKHYLVMATRKGVVKKTNLMAYSRPRAGGIKAIAIDEGDVLVNVKKTDGEQKIILATKKGMAVRFDEKDVRPVGRNSRGVRGIRLRQGDELIGMVVAGDNQTLLTVTENGYGKRTRVTDYRLINRGGIGVRNIICSERNGDVVSMKAVTKDNDLMLISKNGIIIRSPAKGISVIGRNTQGVRLMRLKEGDKVVAAARLLGEKEPEEDVNAVSGVGAEAEEPEAVSEEEYDDEDEDDSGEEEDGKR